MMICAFLSLFLSFHVSSFLLPEVTVRVDDPHPEALDPGLLGSDPLVAAEHAQGELVDSGLQHGAELPLEVGGLVRLAAAAVHPVVAVRAGVQQAVGVRRVVVVVGLDQGEEGLGDVAPLVRPRGRGRRRGVLLGAAPPLGEADAAPAAVAGGLRFVSRTLAVALPAITTSGGAGHFFFLLRLARYNAQFVIINTKEGRCEVHLLTGCFHSPHLQLINSVCVAIKKN